MKKRKFVFFILFIIITLFILRNSFKTASESIKQSNIFVDFFMNVFPFIFKDRGITDNIIRKLAHFTEFFMQGLAFGGIIFSVKYYKNMIYLLFTGLFTACFDEYTQLFSYGRGSQITDVFIDFSGTLFSGLILLILWYILIKLHKI